MKRMSKNIVRLTLLILLVVFLCGCSQDNSNVQEQPASGYQIGNPNGVEFFGDKDNDIAVSGSPILGDKDSVESKQIVWAKDIEIVRYPASGTVKMLQHNCKYNKDGLLTEDVVTSTDKSGNTQTETITRYEYDAR